MNQPLPEAVEFDDVAFRWSDYDTPLWARPNTSPQRWNTAREAPTQYLSLGTEGAWAELIRSEELRSEAELRFVDMPMWVLQVRESRIADYGTFEKAEEAGFPPEALVEEDHGRCQAEATRLRALGFHGILAPSAALPNAVNLTLFGRRLAVEWGCDDASRLASFVPVKQLAVGRPPVALLARTRHLGDSHAGLLEYLRARS